MIEPAIVDVDVGVARGVVPIGHEQVGHLPKQPFAGGRGKNRHVNYTVHKCNMAFSIDSDLHYESNFNAVKDRLASLVVKLDGASDRRTNITANAFPLRRQEREKEKRGRGEEEGV